MSVRTIDVTYRGADYRIAEDIREQGARITYLSPTDEPAPCAGCGRTINHGTRVLVDVIEVRHPACAIKSGGLIETPESISERALAPLDDAAHARAERG